jgi:hypothetical protein
MFSRTAFIRVESPFLLSPSRVSKYLLQPLPTLVQVNLFTIFVNIGSRQIQG